MERSARNLVESVWSVPAAGSESEREVGSNWESAEVVGRREEELEEGEEEGRSLGSFKEVESGVLVDDLVEEGRDSRPFSNEAMLLW